MVYNIDSPDRETLFGANEDGRIPPCVIGLNGNNQVLARVVITLTASQMPSRTVGILPDIRVNERR